MKLTEIAFFTDKVDHMTKFYSNLLGVKPIAQSEGMAIFLTGNTKIFIHRNYTPGEDDLPPENHIAFTVDDVDASSKLLVDQGIDIEEEPRTYYWGRSAYLRDPDGQLIELIQANEGSETQE